jgi:hypothetical protein
VLALELVEPGQQQVATEIRRCRQLQHAADLVLSAGQQTPTLVEIAQAARAYSRKPSPSAVSRRLRVERANRRRRVAVRCVSRRHWPPPPTCPYPRGRRQTAQVRRPDKQLQVIETQHEASIIKKILKETALLAGFIFSRNSQSSLHRNHPFPESKMSQPFTAIATLIAKPGQQDALEQHLRALVEPTRAEAVAGNTICIRTWPIHWPST